MAMIYALVSAAQDWLRDRVSALFLLLGRVIGHHMLCNPVHAGCNAFQRHLHALSDSTSSPSCVCIGWQCASWPVRRI